MSKFTIHKVDPEKDLPDISMLREESVSDGFRFLSRLENDYKDGTNRFLLEGEGLWYVMDPFNEVIAIGGLNSQGFLCGDSHIGRLRRFYVKRAERRNGIGTMLLHQIIVAAADSFDLIVLFTDTKEAAQFYERHGF
ncbi:GNAT family N-acetyltransferase [Jeotgalibacillus malaysiensis]|uniref:GNAT family N-acetyltransferase n=1 Tax=Jeotgalibacillus malaysiensis TaxID=1508404 RepID=UPI00384BC373